MMLSPSQTVDAIVARIEARFHPFIEWEGRGCLRDSPPSVARLLGTWEPAHVISASESSLYVDGYEINTAITGIGQKAHAIRKALERMCDRIGPEATCRSARESCKAFETRFGYSDLQKRKATIIRLSLQVGEFEDGNKIKLKPNLHFIVALRHPYERFALLTERTGRITAYTQMPKVKDGTMLALPCTDGITKSLKELALPITQKFFADPKPENALTAGDLIMLSQSTKDWTSGKETMLWGERAKATLRILFDAQTDQVAKYLPPLLGADSLRKHASIMALVGAEGTRWFWSKIHKAIAEKPSVRRDDPERP